jgi:hypothetical protein
VILAWGIGFILLCCAVLPLVEWLDNRKYRNRRLPRPNWRSARSGRESW